MTEPDQTPPKDWPICCAELIVEPDGLTIVFDVPVHLLVLLHGSDLIVLK